MSTYDSGTLESWKHWSFRVCCLGLLLVVAARASAGTTDPRTVVVSPVPGDAAASGTELRDQLAGISSPSSTNRWLLKVEPGTYDIGSTALPMRSWVDIEGSGIGVTTIRGTVNASASPSHGTVDGASDAELRLLTVEAIATSTVPHVAGIYNSAAFPRLYRVKVVAQGTTGSSVWGIRNVTSAPRIEECEISATSTGTGSVATGITYKNFVSGGQRSSILRSKIAVSGAATNYGIHSLSAMTLTEVRDSRIDVTDGGSTYGIHAEIDGGWSGNESLTVRNTEVSSAGGSSASYGVFLGESTSVYLDVAVSKIWGHVSSTAYGIYQIGPDGAVVVRGSDIVGSTGTVVTEANASIASTELNGGAAYAGGWLGCMGVWDESAVFYTNTCP